MLQKNAVGLLKIVLSLLCLARGTGAQDDMASCYGPGSIATSVIVTAIVTTLLLYVLYVIWKRYWMKRKGKHLVLETDPERGNKGEYAYDNAGFKDAASTPLDKTLEKNGKFDSTPKSKWSQWSPLGGLVPKNEKQKTLDDSAPQPDEIKAVSLKGHDFTGLGFNVYGNMRDGIFIKDVLHRGPASESGKLNPGDRVKSVTINFEHVVYEDALTILSYASPYEIVIEAQGGRISNGHPTPPVKVPPAAAAQLGHPLYRSSSTTDLLKIQKTSKKRLFPASDVSAVPSPPGSLQRSRGEDDPVVKATHGSSPRQLKTQLEQKIHLQNHKQQLKSKEEKGRQELESAAPVQKLENRYQKFGIKVLPVEPKNEQTNPKSAELSQNDNNINLERHLDKLKARSVGVDEVDVTEGRISAPPIKKREKNVKIEDAEKEVANSRSSGETFVRRDSANGSGIKRDKDGIPQEIPPHMLNAAVAARRNRRASGDNVVAAAAVVSTEDVKSPKRPKGRAPAPPEDKAKSNDSSDGVSDAEPPTDNFDAQECREATAVEASGRKAAPKGATEYASDSDAETDNQSSVNTIELNASDITIHQTPEDAEEVQNRRTASTGDLTKMQKTRKTSTGTLERAQSLDITDTAMPPLSKKRKGGSIEESSDDGLPYGRALMHKEPRLSLALDGLNTFQRSRLKKSTEWGNLEDAILNVDGEAENRLDSETHLDALVTKINEIKRESVSGSKNVWALEQGSTPASPYTIIGDKTFDGEQSRSLPMETTPTFFELQNGDREHDNQLVRCDDDGASVKPPETVSQPQANEPKPNHPMILLPYTMLATETLLQTERTASSADPYYISPNKMYDINASDDIKVSRHSLGSLEAPPVNFKCTNVSSITIGEQDDADNYHRLENGSLINITTDADKNAYVKPCEPYVDSEELYTTALDTTSAAEEHPKNDTSTSSYEKVSVLLPNIVTNQIETEAFRDGNDTVTVEGPTSLSVEIHDDGPDSPNETQISNRSFQISTPSTMERSTKSNFSLTYITEIQVPTPSNSTDDLETKTETTEAEGPERSSKYENYSNNFESNKKRFESHIRTGKSSKEFPINEKVDPEKELHKIQEIAEEQLKKLPEMRFSTSSYETPTKPSNNNCSSQIDQLRSNFEKSPPKTSPPKIDVSKSRIPVALSKTPPTSPERRDSRNLDLELNKDIVEIMSSPVHSTPISTHLKYQPKTASKNVSVTSIRGSSKIPSGFANRPPVPPRRYETSEGDSPNRTSTNGSLNSSFKQWVFNPNDNSVTNLTIGDAKAEHK